MSRRRLGIIAGAIAVAFALSAVSTMAQAPNRGGRGAPGGRGGPGGGFGRGGFGMFGGGGTRLVDLAGREALQTELNITNEQKVKIDRLAQEARAKRDKVMRPLMDQMRRNSPNTGRSGRTGRQGAVTPAPRVPTAGAVLLASYQPQQGIGGYGGYGTSPYVTQQPTIDPLTQQRMLQNRQQMIRNQQRAVQNQQRMQGFEQMRQVESKLRKDEEAALAKILDAKQMKRLREIALQMEGPFALLRNQELAQKLSVNPEQLQQIREVEQKDRQAGRNAFQPMRKLMEDFRATQPQAPAQNTASGQPQQQNRGRRGNFDREAFQKFMEQPSSQETVKKMHDDELARRDANYSKVLKVLDRGQASKYRNMLGEKYDTTALRGGMFRGGGAPGGPGAPGAPGNPAPAATAGNAAAQPSSAPAQSNAAATADEAPKAAAPAAAPARAGSLRARRGLGSTAQPQR